MAQSKHLRLRAGDRRETDINQLLDVVMCLSREHEFECEVGLFHDSLTHQQRRLYRKWLGEIADFTGDDAQALHEDFLRQYAPRIVRMLRGKTVEIIKRTGSGPDDMNVAEMAEYMTKVQKTVDPIGIKLTQPHQGTW